MDKDTALEKCKINLMLKPDVVFLSTVLFSMDIIWDETIETANTNGRYIRVCPSFFLKLNEEMRIFLLLHEVYHVVLMHVLSDRRGGRDPQIYNDAADYVINLLLVQSGYVMPVWDGGNTGLLNRDYKDLSTEQVYDIIFTQTPKNNPWSGDLKPCIGGAGGDGTENPIEKPMTQREVDNILIRAHTATVQQKSGFGNLPAGVIRHIDELITPPIPWQQLVLDYVSVRKYEDYSTKRFNRRFLPDFFLPTLYSEGIDQMAHFLDLSGSITKRTLSNIYSCIANATNVCEPEESRVVTFDTELHTNETFVTKEDLEKIEMRGGGGTDIEPVLNWIEEYEPEFAIIFTDGYFHLNKKTIRCKKTHIIWVILDNDNWKAPFGKIVHYKTV